MNIIKISSVIGIALTLNACSTIQNMKGVKAIKTAFSSYDNKVAQFDKGETKATHDATNVIDNTLTIITPKGAVLEDHLVLGNRTYTFTEPGNFERRFTYITEILPPKNNTVGLFLYTKTKCAKQAKHPFLSQGEYIDSATHCLMHRGDDFPDGGMVATYEGTYTVNHEKENDIHEIKMTKAQSVHTVTPNIWSGSIILDMDNMATENDFYNLFTRYKDGRLTFKFRNHSPEELKAAISRQARLMSTKEMAYVDYIDGLSKDNQLHFSHGLTLKGNDPMDGIVTFKFSTEPYKSNGSLLTLIPSYYPSSREVNGDSHNTIDFARQRAKILAMIKRMNNE